MRLPRTDPNCRVSMCLHSLQAQATRKCHLVAHTTPVLQFMFTMRSLTPALTATCIRGISVIGVPGAFTSTEACRLHEMDPHALRSTAFCGT